MVSAERIAPGRQLETDVVENLLGLAHHRTMLQQPKAHFFVAEKEIGGDGEMRAQHNFLMHRVDAVFDCLMRRGERDRFAFPIDFAA